MCNGFWWGDLAVDGYLRSGMGRHGLNSAGSGHGQVAGSFECGNEYSGSIKCRGLLAHPRASRLFRKDSAPWNQLICVSNAMKSEILVCYMQQLTHKRII